MVTPIFKCIYLCICNCNALNIINCIYSCGNVSTAFIRCLFSSKYTLAQPQLSMLIREHTHMCTRVCVCAAVCACCMCQMLMIGNALRLCRMCLRQYANNTARSSPGQAPPHAVCPLLPTPPFSALLHNFLSCPSSICGVMTRVQRCARCPFDAAA